MLNVEVYITREAIGTDALIIIIRDPIARTTLGQLCLVLRVSQTSLWPTNKRGAKMNDIVQSIRVNSVNVSNGKYSIANHTNDGDMQWTRWPTHIDPHRMSRIVAVMKSKQHRNSSHTITYNALRQLMHAEHPSIALSINWINCRVKIINQTVIHIRVNIRRVSIIINFIKLSP